jgi:Protein of unknown function (DUF1353)
MSPAIAAPGLLHSGRPAAAVTFHPDRRRWQLLEDYVFEDLVRGCVLTVPAGFEYNGASVPRILWVALGPHELGLTSTLLHDWLYGCGGRPAAFLIDPLREYSRADADQVLRDLMLEEGVSSWRRRIAYAAVRAFGAARWRRA